MTPNQMAIHADSVVHLEHLSTRPTISSGGHLLPIATALNKPTLTQLKSTIVSALVTAYSHDDAQATQLQSATTSAILQTPTAAPVLPLEELHFEQDHNSYATMAGMGAWNPGKGEIPLTTFKIGSFHMRTTTTW